MYSTAAHRAFYCHSCRRGEKMDSNDLVFAYGSPAFARAFGEMLRDYSRAGTPFLECTINRTMMILRNVRNALAEKTASARKHPLNALFLVRQSRKYMRSGRCTPRPHPELTDYSGYLGYGVPPSMRRRGYGNRYVRAALKQHGSITIP